jgi:hypothetical protein
MVRCEHAAGVQGFGESGMRELLRCKFARPTTCGGPVAGGLANGDSGDETLSCDDRKGWQGCGNDERGQQLVAN